MRARGVLAAGFMVAIVGVALGAQDAISRAPSAADWDAMKKLPDFNGVWETGGGGAPRGGGPAAPAGAGAGRGAAAAPRGTGPAGGPGGAAGNPAARGGAPGGARGGRGGGMQLTEAAETRRKELQSKPAEDASAANCLPPGMPGIMGQPYLGSSRVDLQACKLEYSIVSPK